MATRVPDDAFAAAQSALSDKEIADLTIAVGLINAYNRMAISFRRGPASLDGGETTDEPARCASRCRYLRGRALSDREEAQIERANTGGRPPVVFAAGLWLLQISWERSAAFFEEQGFFAHTPDGPGYAADVAEAKAYPEALAGTRIGRVARHHAAMIDKLHRKPAMIGPSFGGALVRILAAVDLSAATVAIDPAALRGVLPLPFRRSRRHGRP